MYKCYGLIKWFDCCWIFPRSVGDLFQAWHLQTNLASGKIMWSAFPAVVWTIWKERNSRCLKGIEILADVLIDMLNFLIASWLVILLQFQGISIDLILHGSREVAFPFLME